MSIKSILKWLGILALVLVVAYFIVYRFVPSIGQGIDAVVGPTVSGIASSIYLGITTNPTWITYDIYFTFVGGIMVASLIWWQGHNTYNKIRGAAVQSAAQEAGYKFQTAPTAAPVAIPQQQTTTQPVPVEQKKES